MAKLEHKKLTGYECKVRAYLDSQEYLIRKSPAEEVSPIITSPSNLRDRTNEPSGSAEEVITPLPDLRNSTPPLFDSSRVNSFDDHNKELAEVEDGSTEAPPVMFYSFRLLYYAYKFISNQHFPLKSNDRYESDAEIAREGDNNPFIAQTKEDSTKNKFVLSWSYAIVNVAINNVSEKDWLTQDGYNISIDFRKFQAESIKKLEINLTLSYAKEIDTILCLSSIMYCNELKPEYVECSEKTWNGARPRSLIPKELPTVANLVIIEYSRHLNDKQSLNTKWRNNWAKGNTLLTDEDKGIFDCVQIVSRNFFTYLSSVSYNKNKKLDEDMFIHRYCHQILEEIFNQTKLLLVWANGESESSNERRLLDGHNHG
ncbi:hypothetical protein F8M41_007192 [Gigaspora margarita]|uniref:Uncharacterized protein n=1 Tax=Gigaspora margarita TaxID=4874 RepID=A0A8H3X634_GIGMA|nr:hypothetical protein F8M41_007192 [Gigaspora margarita]